MELKFIALEFHLHEKMLDFLRTSTKWSKNVFLNDRKTFSDFN